MSQYTTFTDKFPLPALTFLRMRDETTVAEEVAVQRVSGLAGYPWQARSIPGRTVNLIWKKMRKQLAYLYRIVVYLCKRGRRLQPRFRFVRKGYEVSKTQCDP
jgi:hypothetical protein